MRYFLTTVILFLFSCKPDYVPKPKGYFRIEMPEKKYKLFEPEGCPYFFEIPVYAEALHDDRRGAEPCWFDLKIPYFQATIHVSYKPVRGNVNNYMEDCRTLVYKHTVKATEINEKRIIAADNVSGVYYEIGGSAASSTQFYVTDSTTHFIRGALYFNSAPKVDSLAPVINFLRKDILHLIGTVKWK